MTKSNTSYNASVNRLMNKQKKKDDYAKNPIKKQISTDILIQAFKNFKNNNTKEATTVINRSVPKNSPVQQNSQNSKSSTAKVSQKPKQQQQQHIFFSDSDYSDSSFSSSSSSSSSSSTTGSFEVVKKHPLFDDFDFSSGEDDHVIQSGQPKWVKLTPAPAPTNPAPVVVVKNNNIKKSSYIPSTSASFFISSEDSVAALERERDVMRRQIANLVKRSRNLLTAWQDRSEVVHGNLDMYTDEFLCAPYDEEGDRYDTKVLEANEERIWDLYSVMLERYATVQDLCQQIRAAVAVPQAITNTEPFGFISPSTADSCPSAAAEQKSKGNPKRRFQEVADRLFNLQDFYVNDALNNTTNVIKEVENEIFPHLLSAEMDRINRIWWDDLKYYGTLSKKFGERVDDLSMINIASVVRNAHTTSISALSSLWVLLARLHEVFCVVVA